ncbi:MAG: DNA topoisomerase I, partial [Marinilabiliales bacterium]
EAKLEKTIISIESSKAKDYFIANGEVIKFDGFLKVYIESTDDEDTEQEGVLPSTKQGDELSLMEMRGRERFTKHQPRYTEASLVKKLEELGIGRPSTYAPTISTIQKRDYVVKESRPPIQKEIDLLTLKDGKIESATLKENMNSEKAKLFPTDIGTVVNDFLTQNFVEILEYDFTASVEKEFDDISEGKKEWNQMIKEFYGPFHNKIETTQDQSGKFSGERLLGQDPETGKNVFVKIGRYGPLAQIGDTESEEKPKFAGLRKDQSLQTITLEEALKLFDFPRSLGNYEEKEVTVAIGRFGPYVKHDGKFVSIKKDDNPTSIDLERAIELIEAKREVDRNKLIKSFNDGEIQVLNGRYGPYLAIKKQNFKIPKDVVPEDLTLEDCIKISEDPKNMPKKRFTRKKK